MARLSQILSWLLPWRWFRRLRSRRRLKFTREGKYFVAITIGIGLAAINTGNNLLYLLLGWLLSMIMASGALSDASLRKLTVRRRAPGRLHAHQPFLMEISVTNEKKRLASFSVEIEDLVAGKALDKKCYFLKVPATKTQRTSYRHTFSRRGLYQFDGFRVSTRFPFALFNKLRQLTDPDALIVYPAIHEVPLPAPLGRQLGDTVARRLGRAGEFFGLREYREGDDRRAIHWRSSARSGRLLVREFEEESERRSTLIVDNALPSNPSEDDCEALESAISLTASLFSSYLRHGYAVRLVARGAVLPYGAGEPHLLRALRLLALLETVNEDSAFSGAFEPRANNYLVVPNIDGFSPLGRPQKVDRVFEAGVAL